MSEAKPNHSTRSTPSTVRRRLFHIELRGQVDKGWVAAFEPIAFSSVGCVTMVDVLADQAALRGLLNHLWDLNQEILAVVELPGPVAGNGSK